MQSLQSCFCLQEVALLISFGIFLLRTLHLFCLFGNFCFRFYFDYLFDYFCLWSFCFCNFWFFGYFWFGFLNFSWQICLRRFFLLLRNLIFLFCFDNGCRCHLVCLRKSHDDDTLSIARKSGNSFKRDPDNLTFLGSDNQCVVFLG